MVLVCTIGGAPAPDCAWLAAIFEANWMPYQYCAALDDKRGTALTPMLTEGDNGGGENEGQRKEEERMYSGVAEMTLVRLFPDPE